MSALFEIGGADAAKAQALYPNQGLHSVARAFGASHERAIQYLEQAPVLVLSAVLGGPAVRRINYLYIQHRITPLCERGAPLKDVMRAFGLEPALRKLVPFALSPGAGPIVMALSAVVPAPVLGRIIPAKPGAQRLWLASLGAWLNTMQHRGGTTATRFAWAAEAMSAASVKPGEVTTVADFAIAGDLFNEAWKWPRAVEEATRWHSRISIGRQLRGTPFTADSVIDLGSHPDVAEHDGLRFVALRTPGDLAEEGTAMRHCVASYVGNVIAGRSNIVGIRQPSGERVATLELNKGAIQQLKGKFNTIPPTEVALAVRAYIEALRGAA